MTVCQLAGLYTSSTTALTAQVLLQSMKATFQSALINGTVSADSQDVKDSFNWQWF